MEGKYGKVTEQIIKELTTIVGRDNISTKEHEIEGYSYDEMPLAKPYAPQVIVKPTGTRSIAKFVRRVKEISEEYEVPVIMYGHAGDGNVHLHPICVNMNREE